MESLFKAPKILNASNALAYIHETDLLKISEDIRKCDEVDTSQLVQERLKSMQEARQAWRGLGESLQKIAEKFYGIKSAIEQAWPAGSVQQLLAQLVESQDRLFAAATLAYSYAGTFPSFCASYADACVAIPDPAAVKKLLSEINAHPAVSSGAALSARVNFSECESRSRTALEVYCQAVVAADINPAMLSSPVPIRFTVLPY